MSTMLPAREPGAVSLADVLPSCLASLARGEDGLEDGLENPLENRLGLPPATSVVVVLVDGLGASALRARAGYARTLAASRETLWSGFPTTTAAALTTVTTGTLPGQHGLVGYSVLDAANDRVVKQLSGWDSRLDPETWQRVPTMFEKAKASGIAAWSIGPRRYADSGLTRAILRGAEYRSAESVPARFEAAAEILRSSSASLVYLYVPELDMAGHRIGWESDGWAQALEQVDSEVRLLVAGLRSDQAVLVTSDHGVLDIPANKHVIWGTKPELTTGVRHVAGEPRCLQLHFEPDLPAVDRDALIAAWRASEGHRSWVATHDEAIDSGWFGPVDPVVRPRIGDLLVAARKGIAYYRDADDRGRNMIGQHGSWSDDETRVPLLRFGAYSP